MNFTCKTLTIDMSIPLTQYYPVIEDLPVPPL